LYCLINVNYVQKDSQSVILQHLSNLEDEISSQKEYSSNLLDKIKTKYSSKDASQKSRNSKEVIGKGKSEKVIGRDKLKKLQDELQQEAHAGEVRSDLEVAEADHNKEDEKKKNKDRAEGEDFANGEVVDEQSPPVKTPTKYEYSDEDSVIAVLVFVCDRPSITRSLNKLFEYRPSETKFPIIVSQDCGAHPATTQALGAYGDRITRIMVIIERVFLK
jgi:hypothetical protein